MRRIEVECPEGHREEIVIGAVQRIPRCDHVEDKKKCKKKREIIWRQRGTQGSPGFRVQGLTKRF